MSLKADNSFVELYASDCLCGMQLHTFYMLLLQLHCSDCSI